MSSSSGGGGFASSFGGLSLSPSRDRASSDHISGSSLRRTRGRFGGGGSGIRRGVGIRSGFRANRRRVRHCTIAYRVRLFPFWQRRFLIKFDRLQLSALFDRSVFTNPLLSMSISLCVIEVGYMWS